MPGKALLLTGLTGWTCLLLLGCHVPPPQGSPMTPTPLGSVVDQANQLQEDNAEPAKFIVYLHEFELNKNWDYDHLDGFRLARHDEDKRADGEPGESEISQMGLSTKELDKLNDEELEERIRRAHHTNRIRGMRLTPYGEDHLRQIAALLQQGQMDLVVIERSNTSRRLDTRYHYPVHWNHDLDEVRRQLVVNTLVGLGVVDADALVVVGPAFPFGLNSDEASRAYQQGFQSGDGQYGYQSGRGGSNGGFGGGFGGGNGGGFGSGNGGGSGDF